MMRNFSLVFAILALPACSTMEFVNGPKMEDVVVRKQWHHLGLNGAFELSRPVDLTYDCDDKQWNNIIIEKTIFNALAEVSWPNFSIYSPWTVVYECRVPID